MAQRRPKKAPTIPARPLPAGISAFHRSAVTNGTRYFAEGGEENSAWARRFRDILALRLDDIGGADLATEAQISLARRATTLECELEAMEATLSRGGEADLDLYGRLTGTLARVLEKLGLERVKRATVNPVLDHFARPPERAA